MYKPEPYFYTLHHPMRWVDPYATVQGEERLVLSEQELRDRYSRNLAYDHWLKRFTFAEQPIKPKRHIWQAIQVLDGPSHEWYGSFKDALFRVWVTPETRKCPVTKDWRQWYIICPEDTELVHRSMLKHKGHTIPPRSSLKGERYFSKDKRLRRCLLVPTDYCRHWRHETTGGKVDSLL